MGKFNEYTQKATPADNDTMMIYDATAKANKLSPFSGIWNWIVGKLTNAVISNLQTHNKSVVGALNELNSNPFLRYERTYGTSLTVSNVRGATHGLILIGYTLIPFYISGSSTSGYTIATPQLPDGISVSNNGRVVTITTKAAQVITSIYPYMK
jgi:hypothetical protein|nr:MAG TPA: hypothetical protein [Caudoviricetes sp.]